MPSTYSSNLRLELPADGEQTGLWGQTVNKNVGTLIEEAVAGVAVISLSGASDYTLSALNGATDESRQMVLHFTGGNAQARNVICPAVNKIYLVRNLSNDTLTLKRSGGVTNVTVGAGKYDVVYSHGGNFYSTTLNSFFPSVTGEVTATHTELNILDGVTASAAELNILDGVTASAAELNILDGVTASAAELNILDGVTASAAELNILDGVTASATELNYVDGVTSAIQTQLNAKLSAAGGTMTGPLVVDPGSESAPGVAFSGDTNTGVGSAAPDTLDFVTGGAYQWRVDSDGRLRNTSASQPCFRGANAAARTTAGDFSTFSSETDNTGDFDASSGVFTVPVTGWYDFTAFCYAQLTSGSGWVAFRIVANAASLIDSSTSLDTSTTSYSFSLASGPVYLTATTPVYVSCVGATGTFTSILCYAFAGRLVG